MCGEDDLTEPDESHLEPFDVKYWSIEKIRLFMEIYVGTRKDLRRCLLDHEDLESRMVVAQPVSLAKLNIEYYMSLEELAQRE